MLLDLFTYFAKFPQNSGVIKGIATKGESSMEEYATTLDILGKMEEKELVPEIQNYVYGQSFDELKQRIDKLTGSFLFVDYGEVDIQSDGHRSFECTQRIAVTVAQKLSSNADVLERSSSTTARFRCSPRCTHASWQTWRLKDSTGWTARALPTARSSRLSLPSFRATAGPSCSLPRAPTSSIPTIWPARWRISSPLHPRNNYVPLQRRKS